MSRAGTARKAALDSFLRRPAQGGQVLVHGKPDLFQGPNDLPISRIQETRAQVMSSRKTNRLITPGTRGSDARMMNRGVSAASSGLTSAGVNLQMPVAGGDAEDRKVLRREMMRQRYREQQEAMEREARRRLTETARQNEARYRSLMENYKEEQDGFVREVKRFIDMDERRQQRKKEQLYYEWCDKVFNKIQAQVFGRVDKMNASELNAKKRQLFEQYLEACNTKEGIFRDIVIEEEYNPLAWRGTEVSYSSKAIVDPVKRDLRRHKEEAAFDPQRKNQPLGRQTLDTKYWSMLEATPYHERPVQHNTNTRIRESKISQSHFDVARGRDAVMAEVPLGKKTFHGWKPGQKMLPP